MFCFNFTGSRAYSNRIYLPFDNIRTAENHDTIRKIGCMGDDYISVTDCQCDLSAGTLITNAYGYDTLLGIT